MVKTLAGDRNYEWGYVLSRLPEVGNGRWVCDLGPMSGFQLSVVAAQRGYQVVAIGLESIPVPDPRIRYIKEDINTVDLGGLQFDYILNASTIEHLGLGRYGDPLGENFDLYAMDRLRGCMKPDGIQLLTIPIGQDAVVGYYHRVYGRLRLPLLLNNYKIIEEKYWIKKEDDSAWVECSKERALDEVPGQVPEPSMLNLSYALGGFVLSV